MRQGSKYSDLSWNGDWVKKRARTMKEWRGLWVEILMECFEGREPERVSWRERVVVRKLGARH